MPNLTGLVSDPQFLQLSPADQQATMGAIDPEFGKLNSDDFGATMHSLQAKGISQRPPAVTSGAPSRVPVEEPNWTNSKPAGIPAMGGKVPESIMHSSDALGDTIGGLTIGGAAAMAGAPVARLAARAIAAHPIIGGTIGSELIHKAREIPYLGKMIPPFAEMLPYLAGGGKGKAEAEPEIMSPGTDQIPGRPYMPDPRFERPVPEDLPPRQGPLLLKGETAAPPITKIMHGPETPSTEMLQSRSLATGGHAVEDPSAGLGRIPVKSSAPSTILSPIEAATPPAPVKPADVQNAIEKSLGGQKLVPGVSMRNQPTAQAVAAGKLPEGFTPVDSTALKGYKYNPEAREFESVTQGGQHYIHGDVSPEEASEFEGADSKGKAWQQIRNNPLVAKVVNGKRVSVVKSPVSATPEGEETPAMLKAQNLKEIIRAGQGAAKPSAKAAAPPADAPTDDLTGILQQSLKNATKKKTTK